MLLLLACSGPTPAPPLAPTPTPVAVPTPASTADTGDTDPVGHTGDTDPPPPTPSPIPPASLVRYLTGPDADAVVTPTGPGLILMGGGTEPDEAFVWWNTLHGGGDVVVLRTSGSDGYNDYLFSDIGGVDSVETLIVDSRALASHPYVAWRIEHIKKLARETPQAPCSVVFEEHEWQALLAYKRPNQPLPATPPSVREVTRLTAELGGFLGRKGDGEPGSTTLWRGLQRLHDIATGFLIFKRLHSLPQQIASTRPVPSQGDYG